MIAYDRIYLENAQTTLGFMLDYAVHDVGLTASDAFERFITSGIAERFEHGDPSVVAGCSGTELMMDVMFKTECGWAIVENTFRPDRSAEYWAGWALAYVQWSLGCSFQILLCTVSMDEVIRCYHPYHEMDIRQFESFFRKRLRLGETQLKMHRRMVGISQSELARLSDVPLRTIQQYEQRQKNINHARASYLVALARALSCREGDLLERV